MNIVFRRINDLRVDNDIKTCDLAKRLGISQDNFFDYANEKSNFPLEKLNKFVNFLKLILIVLQVYQIIKYIIREILI